MLRQVKKCVVEHIDVLYDDMYLEFVDGGKTVPVRVDIDAYASKVEFKNLFWAIKGLLAKGYRVYRRGISDYVIKSKKGLIQVQPWI